MLPDGGVYTAQGVPKPCAEPDALTSISPRLKPAEKAVLLDVYDQGISTLGIHGWITQTRVTLLHTWTACSRTWLPGSPWPGS